jgi:hypothetical protein
MICLSDPFGSMPSSKNMTLIGAGCKSGDVFSLSILKLVECVSLGCCGRITSGGSFGIPGWNFRGGRGTASAEADEMVSFNYKLNTMKNFNQIIAAGIIVLSSMTISNAQTQGPILAEKLEAPETIVKQTLQKRALIWIDGQWEVQNGEYIWVSGHWENKKIGYVFINGKWTKKGKGWIWTDGYWKKIDINKWLNLYA